MPFTAYTYRFPFKRPFRTAAATFTHREGLVLCLQTNGIQSWGEAAPLPGFSRESLKQVIDQLQQHYETLQTLLHDDGPPAAVLGLAKERTLAPSLQMAFYTLSCLYHAQKKRTALHHYLRDEAPGRIKLNAIVDISATDLQEHINERYAQGYTTVKIKADSDFVSRIPQLAAVQKQFPGLSFRIDANQSWLMEPAVEVLNAMHQNGLRVEYCEEPLKNPSPKTYRMLREQTDIPLALDESLEKVFHVQEAAAFADVLIIKPTVLGPVYAPATGSRARCVFTSSLESGLGRLMTASLAAASKWNTATHGLATGSLLSDDFWGDDSFVHDGHFHLPDHHHLRRLMQAPAHAPNLQPVSL